MIHWASLGFEGWHNIPKIEHLVKIF
jgi:hypothetical protein